MKESKKTLVQETMQILNELSVVGLAKIIGYATAVKSGEGKRGRKNG